MGRIILDCAVVTAALLWLSAAPVLAEEDACSEDEVLISLSAEELASAMPCTSLGAYFIVGFGIENEHYLAFPLMPRDSEIPYPYYAPTRIYWASLDRGDENTFFENFTALLSANAFHIRRQTESTDVRADIYSTFMLGEYWNGLSPTSNVSRGFLSEGMIYLMMDVGLDNYLHVTRFVRFDIPSLDIETVISSQNFTNCVESGGPNQ
jgi:hypothetical protein